MIRHFVAFSFKRDTADETRDGILSELRTFPARFPAMKNWRDGRNISRRDQTFEYAFAVEFDSEVELLAYLNSGEHECFVKERFRPNIEARAIISFETDNLAASAR
jgi:hypothetical protein